MAARASVARRRRVVSGSEESQGFGVTWVARVVGFVAVIVALFASSYLAGARGMFFLSDHRLGRQLVDPATRADATAALASRVAIAVAANHPVFAGVSDAQTCPSRYAARATSIIEAMSADDAFTTLAAAGSRLNDAGWQVDPAPAGRRRVVVSARNRQGIQLSVTEVAGSGASSIEVSVLVPCEVVTPRNVTVTSTTTGG